MGTRQYIGARYVPKFADPIEWNNSRSYEALEVVTYLGTSYTSKKPVPVGVAITNSEYWVATGNYNAQVEAYREEVDALADKFKEDNIFIDVADFGVTGTGDESEAFQDAIDFATENNIPLIISNTDIQFKEISVEASLTFDFRGHTAQGIQISQTSNRIYNMITVTGAYDVVFKNVDFEGYYYLNDSGDKPAQISAIKIFGANSAKFINCKFQNFSERWYAGPVPFAWENRRAVLCTIHDTNYTLFDGCYINNCGGEELMYIIAVEKSRESVNMEMRNTEITGNLTQTSVFDFVGNYCVLENNIYNYTYEGSCLNAFAMHLKSHADTIKASYGNVFDVSELNEFQAETVEISDLNVYYDTPRIYNGAAKYVHIDHINAKNHVTTVCALTPGYGHENPQRYYGSEELAVVKVLIENTDFRNAEVIASKQYVGTTKVDITVNNCRINSFNYWISNLGGVTRIINNEIKAQLCNAYPTNVPVAYFYHSSIIPYAIFFQNNSIIGVSENASSVAIRADTCKLICTNNISDAENAMTVVIGDNEEVVNAGNINIANAE